MFEHDIGDFKLGLDWTLTQLPGIVNISNEWTLSAGNPDIASISSPEADVCVQVESALVKASRDTVSFNEQQPTTGTTLALSVDKLLSVGASSMAVRVAR